MARVVCTIDEPLEQEGGRMAGLQVRVHELAGALARAGHAVEVATADPRRVPVAADYVVGSLADAATLAPADVWVTHPRLVARLHRTLRARALVVDGYESPFGSFLAQAAALLPRLGERVVHEYRAEVVELLAALLRADRVLGANESQRVSYLTLLAALGRIGPRTSEVDPVLTVSSGAPPAPLAPGRAPEVPTVLWAGGCYPWFDVATFTAAMPLVAARVPAVRFVVAGAGGIDETDAARPAPHAHRLRQAIETSDDLRARTRFAPWAPYRERGACYREASLAVCTQGAHLETTLAMRTRVLDALWGGLPVVVSAGDAAGELATRAGAGLSVPPGDAMALAEAVAAVLDDEALRGRMAAAAHALARGPLAWDRQVEPLARYCAAVAAGEASPVPEVDPAGAVVRLNDGPGVRAADLMRRGRRLLERLAAARSRGDGPLPERASARRVEA